MEFGNIPYTGLDEEFFTFPEIDMKDLPGIPAQDRKIYIGFPKMDEPDYYPKLYPERIHPSEKLSYYSRKYNTLELNATHYRSFQRIQFLRWLKPVEDIDFTFCPKFPKWLSHPSTDENKLLKTLEFFGEISNLQKALGPAFIQYAPSFNESNRQKVIDYLSVIPQKIPAFVEVRHESWFDQPQVIEDFFKQLKAAEKGWIITDTPGRRDVLHFRFPIPRLMVRFVCEGDHQLDIFRIAQWKKLLQQLYANGLETCWFFLHVHHTYSMLDFSELVQLELNPTVHG